MRRRQLFRNNAVKVNRQSQGRAVLSRPSQENRWNFISIHIFFFFQPEPGWNDQFAEIYNQALAFFSSFFSSKVEGIGGVFGGASLKISAIGLEKKQQCNLFKVFIT